MQEPAKTVLVVADPNRESSSALQYVLSHSVLDHDELILFHVENPSNWIHAFHFNTFLKIPPANAGVHAMSSDHGSGSGTANLEKGTAVKDFLEEMKKECNRTKPKLNVRIERVAFEAGRDRANTILHHSEVLGVDIVVIGQKRSLFAKGHLGSYTWPRPGGRSSGSSSKGINTAEYLIENCKCTCVGVQKKALAGGYVLNSKTHKNFGLLA
ncbi:hypothetical protein ACLB2K_031095 [Fragaria x ananassa]